MTALKYRVRCVEAYTHEIAADKLVSHTGRELCDVPGYSFSYVVGHESGFRTRKARDEFMKAHPGKWAAA